MKWEWPLAAALCAFGVAAVVFAVAGDRPPDDAPCGDLPRLAPWDGGLLGLEAYVGKRANDPASVDASDCVTVSESPPPRCWALDCTVRGENGFGALVASQMRVHVRTTRLGLLTWFIDVDQGPDWWLTDSMTPIPPPAPP